MAQPTVRAYSSKDYLIIELGDGEWLVQSHSDLGGFYRAGPHHCECGGFEYRRDCSHAEAVRAELQARKAKGAA